jgi:hypothetical protein
MFQKKTPPWGLLASHHDEDHIFAQLAFYRQTIAKKIK